jgi:hypothetical protein
MTQAKIAITPPQTIPLDKPVVSDALVPHTLSEDSLGKRPTIKIYVSGGVVQDITCDGAAIVIVHDADNEAEASEFEPYEPLEYRFPEGR